MYRTVVLSVALVLFGCSGSPDRGIESAAHNDADAAFVRDMIPHHEQAVEMAEMVSRIEVSDEIVELADEIRAAQTSETAQMRRWMSEWNIGVDPHAGHGGNSPDDHGMMSPDEMKALGAATGDDFERRWLTMMIEHHRGALTMAKAVIEGGSNPSVRALATAIVAGQTAEIDEMTALLAER